MKLRVIFARAAAVLFAAESSAVPPEPRQDRPMPADTRFQANGISASTPYRGLVLKKTNVGFQLVHPKESIAFSVQFATRTAYDAFMAQERQNSAFFEAWPVERPGNFHVVHVARHDTGNTSAAYYYTFLGPETAGLIVEFASPTSYSNFIEKSRDRSVPTLFMRFADSIEPAPGAPNRR